ncbi:hypothetical protein GWI33_001976 [Rhynchophorus ferrugineus]|uniref:Alpha-carbonic anhydrase domain-containing protein n=1 Tax=Rhynchophorus ferrugineus TaxID=354439 RepID=A0A834MJV2_RHYFE|nr:hypothetical protein GWI33_001976 [Rhynchophorus ferrugineus]
MECIRNYLPDQVGLYYYFVIAIFVFGALYLNDMFNKLNSNSGKRRVINYGYDFHNGPSVWKDIFSDAGGTKQSPVNLVTACSITVPSEIDPLQFSDEFYDIPIEMKLYNSGLNVVLYGKWNGNIRPFLVGGPLEETTYSFLNIRFRWGPTNDEGSEHMINTKRYAMEMQASFVNDKEQECDVLEAARTGKLLIVSYLFSVTPIDNPYLEPVIQALRNLKLPMNCVVICPFPLKLLMPIFSKNYFYYDGSLTFPPCTEGVKWIVQPEPLTISDRQLKKFRKLASCSFRPITCNSRPVQHPNGREILFYD